MAEQNLQNDIDGFDRITDALLNLLNSFPLLATGETIAYAMLEESTGKSMFAIGGAVIKAQRESVTGHVKQKCMYPFQVVFRATGLSQNRKIAVKERLDALGRWLEKQTISDGEASYTLEEYPVLEDGRIITEIKRTSPAYINDIESNDITDTIITIQCEYDYEFDR